MKRTLMFSLILFFMNAMVMASDIITDSPHGKDGYAEVLTLLGEVLFKTSQGEDWRKLEVGEAVGGFVAIKTNSQSYLKLLLKDNSVVHFGENTAVTMSYSKGYSFNLSRGKVRILSLKENKVVTTEWGSALVKRGEFIWDVYELNKKLKVEITALGGKIEIDGEVLTPEEYDAPPETKPYSAYSYDYPYLLYFGEKPEDRFKSYVFDFSPNFPSRTLASEDAIEVVIEETKSKEEILSEGPVFDKVKGEIWVHDIAYDETVRIVEKKTSELAKDFLPTALKTASENLVWEVASRSVVKWGIQYANNVSKYQVPRTVEGSYLSRREPASSYYEKDFYRESTEQIAEVRAYRAAKIVVLKKGYEKGWREAQRYAQMMLPKIITPVISKKIYEEVKPLALKAVKKAVEKSKLVFTPDVERLVDHLSQISATKECERWIEKMGPVYTRLSAQNAAKEAARNAAEDIAFHMSQKSKKRAGKLMGDLLARERARKVARDVAQEAQEEKAESFKRRSRRYFIESQR